MSGASKAVVALGVALALLLNAAAAGIVGASWLGAVNVPLPPDARWRAAIAAAPIFEGMFRLDGWDGPLWLLHLDDPLLAGARMQGAGFGVHQGTFYRLELAPPGGGTIRFGRRDARPYISVEQERRRVQPCGEFAAGEGIAPTADAYCSPLLPPFDPEETFLGLTVNGAEARVSHSWPLAGRDRPSEYLPFWEIRWIEGESRRLSEHWISFEGAAADLVGPGTTGSPENRRYAEALARLAESTIPVWSR